MQHCLLTDPVIAVTGVGVGPQGRVSLPEVLARVVGDGVAAFPELAPWQAHAWHAFLVQVAGLALVRAGRDDPPAQAAEWADLLRSLGRADGWDGEGDEPWCLVVEDWTKPAFLQPPLPAATHGALKPAADRPDLLDVLLTAKNHDVKAGRADRATPGQWLFALLSLQTMQGFSGNTLYGIARMNGGFSSRPALGLVPWTPEGWRPGPRFVRDLRVLLRTRERFFADRPYRPDGLGLIWLAPWDGVASLGLGALDPWFVEVCRRVRLREADGGALVAFAAGSKAARIEAKALNGNLGDPWVPVDKKGAALTVSGRGFHYTALCDLMSRTNYLPSLMQRPHKGIDDGAVALLARVLVRGQGQTEGYHERLVPVPSSFLDEEDVRQVMGTIFNQRIEDVKSLSRHVLYPALRRLLRPRDGDDGKLPPGEQKWVAKWLDDLDHRVDVAFFNASLWAEVRAEVAGDLATAEAQRLVWLAFLRDAAEDLMARAMAAAPKVLSRTYRSRAEAQGLFRGQLRRTFEKLFPHQEESAHG